MIYLNLIEIIIYLFFTHSLFFNVFPEDFKNGQHVVIPHGSRCSSMFKLYYIISSVSFSFLNLMNGVRLGQGESLAQSSHTFLHDQKH